MLIYNDTKYTAQDLNRIGDNLALMWGGTCNGFAIDEQNKKVIFSCSKRSEGFFSELDYDELQEYAQTESTGGGQIKP